MQTTTSVIPAPTTAERVRTALIRADTTQLAIDGCDPLPTSVHHLLDDGQVAVVVAEDSLPVALAWQAGSAGIPAMLELTDHSPIALRNPVRSLIWLSGTLRPVEHPRRLAAEIAEILPHPELLDVGHRSELLCLTLDSVVAADTTGAEAVDVTEVLDAAPDPFAALETGWLQHLEEDHADIVRQIARRIPARAPRRTDPPPRSRPLRTAPARRVRRRRPRRADPLPRTGRRSRRPEPRAAPARRLPLPQRTAAAHLSGTRRQDSEP